jgi:signal transduction histidine kinase
MDVLSRFVLDHLPEPVIVLDSAGKLLEANRAARDAAGPDIAAPFGGDELAPTVSSFLDRSRHAGGARLELPPTPADPARAPLYLRGVAIGDYFVVRLERSVEQTAVLAELNHFRRVETLGLLTARIVHDVNNLLTPVLLFTRDLIADLEARGENALLVREIETTAERAASLLKSVLGFARPRPAQVQPVSLNSAIAGLRPIIELLVGPEIRLVFSLHDTPLHVEVDRVQLEQTLLNLVSNAKSAMPHGGQLSITTCQASLGQQHAGGQRWCSHAVLIVNDTGIGMTEDVRRRALEAFFTTRAASGGTGLGLSSVQQFVKESRGLLTLNSEAGRGTTVVIRLPRAERGPTRNSLEPC